jgi:hypothetical protein
MTGYRAKARPISVALLYQCFAGNAGVWGIVEIFVSAEQSHRSGS